MEATATKREVPDEEVSIRISSCRKCGGSVRQAVVHRLDSKTRAMFNREVLKYDLAINEMKLLDYRNAKLKWCNCK
jgi:hypothetical protein